MPTINRGIFFLNLTGTESKRPTIPASSLKFGYSFYIETLDLTFRNYSHLRSAPL